MDSLPEDEIEAIWQRNKAYIETKNIKSISKKMIQDEIEAAMKTARVPKDRVTNPQAMMDFLIDRGFPKEAVENPKIRKELLGQRISKITVRGKPQFQIAKGTPTVDGIKAGQFISGKTKDQAILNLQKKANA